MIYDPTQVLLATAVIKGISPKLRDALRSISTEMLPDSFCRDVYKAVMALDNFNATVNLNAVYEQSGNMQFSDLGAFAKDVIPTNEPSREAAQIKNAYCDMKAVAELTEIVEKIKCGRVFNRDEVSNNLQKISSLLAPTSQTKPVFFSEYEESYLKILEAREANPELCFLDIGLDVEINKTDLIVIGGQPGIDFYLVPFAA